MNQKLLKYFDIGLSILIIIDIILLIFSLVFNLTTGSYYFIIIFDTILCVFLLSDFIYRYKKSENKRKFLYKNWTELLAAMPFDLILFPICLSYSSFLIVLRILKFIKVIALIVEFFETIGIFLRETFLDEILGITVIIVITSTLGLYLFDNSMNNLFDNLWFVIVTITTVGYGDVVPHTAIGKSISLILLIVGALIFSAISGAMASYFTRRIFEEEMPFDYKKTDELKKEMNQVKTELNDLKTELNESKQLNNELKKEIINLNNNLKKKED